MSEKNLLWDYAKQVGVNHAVMRLPEDESFDLCNAGHWKDIYDRFSSYGLKPVVIEPLPNLIHSHIKIGDILRDECINKVIKMFSIMDQLDIRTICVNFMAHIGWYRTENNKPERGNALVTAFDLSHASIDPKLSIDNETLWYNLKYFLTAVVPYAERFGIKIALHPDDPPVKKLGNVSRILTSPENMQRAIDLVPSESVGITLCQGTFAAMGADIAETIRHFCKQGKVFFVHFRDIRGNSEKFSESFHDNGMTNMAKAILAYKECNFIGPIRVDHVPTMAGETNLTPGYASVGRLFAIGYLKGLLDCCGYKYI